MCDFLATFKLKCAFGEACGSDAPRSSRLWSQILYTRVFVHLSCCWGRFGLCTLQSNNYIPYSSNNILFLTMLFQRYYFSVWLYKYILCNVLLLRELICKTCRRRFCVASLTQIVCKHQHIGILCGYQHKDMWVICFLTNLRQDG